MTLRECMEAEDGPSVDVAHLLDRVIRIERQIRGLERVDPWTEEEPFVEFGLTSNIHRDTPATLIIRAPAGQEKPE